MAGPGQSSLASFARALLILVLVAQVRSAPVARGIGGSASARAGGRSLTDIGPISWLCTRPIVSNFCSTIGRAIAPTTGGQIIATPSGPVYGALVASSKGVRYTVPYAQPPVAGLRFADPVKVAAWSSALNASTLPRPCAQSGDSATSSTTEDCLFINIFAPASAIGSSRLPVFVWIHGGSGIVGSSTAPGLDGSTLAIGQSLIVVTVQYRLGALGNFVSPSLGIGGNQAAKDVILALSMIRTDIASYGGDPARVTLGGQSSGASLVATLLAAPAANSLFQRAILQSAPLDYGDQSLATASAVGSAFMAAVNCTTLDCLRSASVGAILDAQANVVANAPSDIAGVAASIPLRAYVDGALVKGNFMALSSGGLASTGRPIILSVVRDEAAPTIALISGGGSLPLSAQASLISALAAPADRAAAVSASGLYATTSTANNAVNDALTLLGTDGVWRCATVQIGVNITASRQSPAVYLMELEAGGSTYVSNADIAYCQGRVCHEDDIYDTFDTAPSPSAVQAAVQAEHVARWSAFVKSGSPNAAGLPTWSPIASATQLNALLMGSPSTFAGQLRPEACGPTGLWGRGAVLFDSQIYGT